MASIIKHKNISKSVLLLAVTFTLQSCFVAKNYDRPEFEETENLYRTDALPTDSISMADISWKDMFTDTYLNEYIQEGLENNIDIRLAIQQMAAAQAYYKQGKAGYFPTLGAKASMTHQELAKNSQFGSFFNGSLEQFEISGNLSWEADIWGKIRSTKRASEASYLQSVAAHQAVKTQLVSSIASVYYQLLALDAQLNVTRETIETREKSVETIKALKDAGQVTQVAVDQNIAQYNNAKALEVDLRAAIFTTENTLNLLLGRTSVVVERGELESQDLDSEIKLGVPSLLLSNRPDVMAAEFGLIQSFEMTNVARSNFYPSLTITATGGLQSLQLDQLINTNSLFANIVGGLTQPIFNQRKIRTQKEVADAQQEQALLNFKKALLTAGSEVSNALYKYNAETEKFEYRQKEVEALRNAEVNSEELLQNGYATYLDLLTARQSALNAELNVIDNKLQQLLSVVTIYEALGGGWK
ncbi:efflux transporter outer membrane subunit [Aestuariibaculum suncheonense]|uniref:Efflux transporter outer membrane subunit n=1 Tax=Aestuariibaculum suncheonense TaxID=1028745 RepID=A0A8J6QKF5_9FLAO|nr:efflux transporter outer membrane subunit [Aestuariibaculum suncheonense]MBD0836517.1 efflux transporter outer membrane subunit [Aestuariibaculum suncheonense]